MKTKGARNYTDEELELLYTLRVEQDQDYNEIARQFDILSKFKPAIHTRTDSALERKCRDLNWHTPHNKKSAGQEFNWGPVHTFLGGLANKLRRNNK